MKILDISKFQPDVDYVTVAKQIDGVILRIGLTYWGAQNMSKDSHFDRHYAGFKATGVPIGVYFYSAADTVATAKLEAQFCLNLLKGKQFEFPIYYDVENNQRQGKLTKKQLTDIVDSFCTTVQNAGYFVGYYSYTSWLQTKLDTAYLSKKYTLWKADYRDNYDKLITCDMHQFTCNGQIQGIGGNVDLSSADKDFPQIIMAAGLNGFSRQPPQQTDEVSELKKALSAERDARIKLEEKLASIVAFVQHLSN